MSRSRSSFDLSGAIATAASLSVVVPEEQPSALYRGMPLVSFTMGDPQRVPQTPPELAQTSPEVPQAPTPSSTTRESPLAAEDAPAVPAEIEAGPMEAGAPAAQAPDLSEIKSLVVRSQKIIAWIVEAVGASDVFIADAAGLPLAGAIADAEARLGATGIVASAVAHLAAAIPGNSSALFEMHVGEGPFFQLIGFEVAAQSYVVGFQRPTPLGFRQAHAVRLACRHALAPGAPGNDDPDPATHPRGSEAQVHTEPGSDT